MLGFFAVGLFTNDEAINVRVSVPIVEDNLILEDVSPVLPQSKRKNCVPADSSLKYQTLPYNGSEVEAREIDTNRLIETLAEIERIKLEKDDLKKSGKKNVDAIQNELKRLDRQNKELKKRLQKYDIFPSEQNLLYVERCSDYGESMKIVPTGK